MADKEQIGHWISEFEAIGEQLVRDSINFRNGLMGGEAKLSTALTWLRDQERKREAQAIVAFNYIRWTFWAVSEDIPGRRPRPDQVDPRSGRAARCQDIRPRRAARVEPGVSQSSERSTPLKAAPAREGATASGTARTSS